MQITAFNQEFRLVVNYQMVASRELTLDAAFGCN